MYIHSEKMSGKKLVILEKVFVGTLLFVVGGIIGIAVAYQVIADYLDITYDPEPYSQGVYDVRYGE